MKKFRQWIFWVHLVSGVVAGVVIAIMSATGIIIAFEEEILAWVDRDVSKVSAVADAERLPLEEAVSRVALEQEHFAPNYVQVFQNRSSALAVSQGRDTTYFVNPYTGEAAASRAHAAHEVLHKIEDWHRWLGMTDGALPVGRWITGICNSAFLVLCITGLYLWFPRVWRWRVWRPALWFVKRAPGKARHFNWHNVVGFWSLPVLLILVATGVVISYEWAHRLVFNVVGEEAPKARNFLMMAQEPLVLPDTALDGEPLPMDAIVAQVAQVYPDWESIGISLSDEEQPSKPLQVDLFRPDYMPNRAWTPLDVDPYTGDILRATELSDRSPGLQARVWIRFLHTGGAYGIPGKIIASVASAAALLLVYTGFALSWHRLRASRRRAQA